VITIMQKHTIITLKNEGHSNREIARMTGINRKTVARYWNDYKKQLEMLETCNDTKKCQELITEGPKYNSSSRKAYKYTDEIDEALDEILALEDTKKKELGANNKQMLSCAAIHKILVAQGFDIGVTTIQNKVKEKRKRTSEAFIRQEYDLADRLEYDFGEVVLIIGGIKATYHMAVFGAPASKFRYAYLYPNQRKEVFLDSHVRFFEMVGGVYKRIVYDNMKNVVTRFIGRNEKELNTDLVKMSMYYGFSIDTTNCYAGNEKGFVEGSVKAIRKLAFSKRYRFSSLNEAQVYLERVLAKSNEESAIADEIACPPPPLEIARISEHRVDKYSFVRVENNFYSVPEYLVGRKVNVKSYPTEIVIYSGLEKVCAHQKHEGTEHMQINIFHYLDTLSKKPGALKNSAALKNTSALKAIFDTHYQDNPKKFIDLLKKHEQSSIPEIILAVEAAAKDTSSFSSAPSSTIAENVLVNTRANLGELSKTFLKRGEKVAS